MKLLRGNDELDAATARELDAIDGALDGQRVEPDLADLARLVTELRENRPVTPVEFAGRLDGLIDAGFPASSEREQDGGDVSGPEIGPPRIAWSQLRRVLVPAAAVAASLAIAAVAVVSSGVLKSSDGSRPSTVAQGNQDRPSGAVSATPTSRSDKVIEDAVPTGATDAVRQREVERSARLTLAAAANQIEDVADGVVRVTDRYRGYVVSSSVSGGDAAHAQASLELRIPSAHAQDAIADLSKLAHVRERTQSTADITSSFVSVRARIARATRERALLLQQLASASTPNQAASVKTRLRAVELRLSQLRAQSKRLNSRASYSSVSVAVQPDEAAGSDGKFTPGDALDDVRDILGATLGALLVGLAVLGPTVLLVGLGWLATRGARRRMRERALDASDGAGSGTDPDAR